MSKIRKFPYILVDEDGDMHGIDSEEQAELYNQDESNAVYDVAQGTWFGSADSLPEAEEIEGSDGDYDEG